MDDNSMRKSFSDEQLGEISGGLFDNDNCNAWVKGTVNVLS
jgi:hypothetical protein